MKYESSAKADFAKLPSFLQWLKTISTEEPIPTKVVKTVWFPNKFPNFSLDTESFRLRITVSAENLLEFQDAIESAIDNQEVLLIRVIDSEDATYSLETLPGEVGLWEALGSTGFSCSVSDRPKPNQRASKKPVTKQ